MQPWYLDRNHTILVLPRTYSSDIYQTGATPGISSFRCGQGAPNQLNSPLLYKDKESAKSSQFTAHQLAILAVQARIQCWLVLGLPGVREGCTSTVDARVLLSTLYKNGHCVSLLPVMRHFVWLPWPFKYHGECLGNDISQFPQNSGMHLVRSHRLMHIQVPQVFPNLVFPYSRRGLPLWSASCSPSTGEGQGERLLVKTEAKKVVEYLSLLLIC